MAFSEFWWLMLVGCFLGGVLLLVVALFWVVFLFVVVLV